MGIYTEYNGSSKVVSVGVVQTLSFTPSDLSNNGILAFHFSYTGAGNQLSTTSRVRVKASGSTIWETSMFQLRSYIQSCSPFNLAMADADVTFTIPFRILRPWGLDRMPNWMTASQFPVGAQPAVEIVTTTGAVAGTIVAGWTWTDEPAVMYPRMLANALNIAASSNSARYNLNLPGEVFGIITPTEGVDQFRLTLSGRVVHHLPGPQFGGASVNLLNEHQRMFGGNATAATASPDGDPLYVPVLAGLPAAEGSSYLEYFTGAAWNGAANEAVIHELVPVR